MAEEMLIDASLRRRRRFWIALAVSVLPAIMAGMWLGRVPIAENVARSTCKDHDLDCDIDIVRLDFGGVTLRNLSVGENGASLLSADRLAVDFLWATPLSPRAGWVGGEKLQLQLDLSGKGPVLGGLQRLLDSLPEPDPDAKPAPAPRLGLEDVRVVAQTSLGPLEASGHLRAPAPGEFDIHLVAPPVSRVTEEGVIEFTGGSLLASSAGGALSGELKLALAKLQTAEVAASNLSLNVMLSRGEAGLAGRASALADRIDAGDAEFSGARIRADLEAAGLDLARLTGPELLARVRSLALEGEFGSGSTGGAKFGAGRVEAKLALRDGGGAAGPVSMHAMDVTTGLGAAERVDVGGEIQLPGDGPGALARSLRASGTARLSGARLDQQSSEGVSEAVASPLRAILPAFGAAAASAARRAGERFDLVVPWSFEIDDGGFDASALGGTAIESASGLKGVIEATAGPTVFAYTARNDPAWRAAGAVRLAGGGAPDVHLDVREASGDPQGFRLSGRGALHAWRVNGQTFDIQDADLALSAGPAGGRADVAFAARLSGELAGLVWEQLATNVRLKASWAEGETEITLDGAAPVSWRLARTDAVRLGAGLLTYSPEGPLARSAAGGAMKGAGVVSLLDAPISGDGFTGRVRAGPSRVSWTAGEKTEAAFDVSPVHIDLGEGDRAAPISFGSLKGELSVKDGWSVDGSVARGEARLTDAHVSDASARFEFSGSETGELSGRVSDLVLSISDPAVERRYEALQVTGAADLANGRATGEAQIVLAGLGLPLGEARLVHDLETSRGNLDFNGAPLIFRADGLQPYRLSPLLRGPANVSGRVDLSATMNWTPERSAASATAALANVGFALAAAGVYEGVSGRIEVADLFSLRSAPGQTLTIDRVTLGMPFEDGRISFQLVGFDGVRLERARWPFAGGELRIRPIDYVFAGTENRFVGEAVDWDLATLIERFKVPDIRAEGRVSGRFPIVFSTGSARIEDAVLEASEEGGVIQYTGSAADAAAGANENAKMLFDALKDFRYRVMRIGLDGDLADRMVLTVDLEGRNPEVLAGSAFDIGISIDSPLMGLLNLTNQGQEQVDAVVRAATGTD
jgi:translocation and assembly module TamB